MAKTDEKGGQKVLRGMHEVLKGLKEQRKALGPRQLSPEGRRKQALGRFLSAIDRRGWTKFSPGQYKMGKHTVRTTQKFYVVVDEDIKLELGEGCINYFDSYVKSMVDVA